MRLSARASSSAATSMYSVHRSTPCYNPLKDAGGAVIGATYVGFKK